MTQIHRRSWTKLIFTILVLRLVGALFHAFAPVTMPHTWRQVDTLGTALRYALRWSVEHSSLSWWIPAVLNSGDTPGVMAMEFPLLNILGGFGFLAAGSNVDLGRSLAHLVALLVTIALGWVSFCQWQKADRDVPELSVAALGALVLSFATPYSSKFLPDVTAMSFALLGVAGLWRLKLWGVIPLAIAVMIKPTTSVTALMLLLHPCSQVYFRRLGLLLGLTTLPAAFWYLKILPQLKGMQERTALFTIPDTLDPWNRIEAFWTSGGVWEAIDFHALFPFGWILLLIALIFLKRQRSTLLPFAFKCLIILAIQATVVGALSGAHAELHSYYLLGLAPMVIVLTGHLWRHVPWISWRIMIALGLLFKTGEAMVADSRGFWDDRQGPAWFKECSELRGSTPEAPWRQNVVWRTPIEQYPLLDLCLGERGQSETAEWGLFRKESGMPDDCTMVSETARLRLVHCRPKI